jgi:hypothetical protein
MGDDFSPKREAFLMRSADVSNFLADDMQLINDLEGALEHGALSEALAGYKNAHPGVARILAHYKNLSERPKYSTSSLRPSWVRHALAVFQEALVEPEFLWPAIISHGRLILEGDKQPGFVVRPDQVSQCRQWRQWFTLCYVPHELSVTARLTHAAVDRLASDLASIEKLERLHLGGASALTEFSNSTPEGR